MIGQFQEGGELVVSIGHGVDMNFSAELFPPQPGFVQGAGGGALEGFADQGKQAEHGETFQGENDFRAGAALDPVQHLEVRFDLARVHHITGSRDLTPGRRGLEADRCRHGQSSATVQGNPY